MTEVIDDLIRGFLELYFDLRGIGCEEKEKVLSSSATLRTSHLGEAGKFRSTCVLAVIHDRALSLGLLLTS